MRARRTLAAIILALVAVVIPATTAANATPAVPAPVTGLGDGAWSWFEGPRAIVTGGGCELLASATGGSGATGMVNVESRYPQTSAANARPRTTVTVDTTLSHDDHSSGALLKLADGEILTAWSGHAQDSKVRVAVRSGARRTWTRLPGFQTSGPQTYNNLFQLSSGAVLDFTRTNPASTPHVYRSLDNGRTWAAVGELLRFTADGNLERPYVEYAQRGDRIAFITTQGHPRELATHHVDSAVYAGYLEGTTVYRSDSTVAGAVGSGVEVTDLSPVFVPPAGSSAWVSSLTFDGAGEPVAAFSVRNRGVDPMSPAAIRYAQARHTAAGWSVHDVAPAGRALYPEEADYPGTIATDPADPNHVVISSSVNPRSTVSLDELDLFEGRTTDGTRWTWTRVTATHQDELRPVFTNTINGMQALVWFAGRYRSYTDYTTTVQYRMANPLGIACP